MIQTIRKIATERDWDYEEATEEEAEAFFRQKHWHIETGYKTKLRKSFDTILRNGDHIKVLVYDKKVSVKDLYAESVLFHWNAEETDCKVFVIPLYSPDDGNDPCLFNYSGIEFTKIDMKLHIDVYEDYDDSYDIHDHGHERYYRVVVYDAETKTFSYMEW